MPPDNVTPFRPRRPPPRPAGQGSGLTTHRGKAVLVQALTLATFLGMFFVRMPPWHYLPLVLGIAAVAIAFSNRQDGMPWAQTHHEHALRTVLIGYAIWTLSSLILGLFGAGMQMTILLIQLVVLLWAGVRAIVGVALAIMRKPVWRPRGVLF